MSVLLLRPPNVLNAAKLAVGTTHISHDFINVLIVREVMRYVVKVVLDRFHCKLASCNIAKSPNRSTM